MALSVDQFSNLYNRLAPKYDRKAKLFSLLGFEEAAQKRQAVAALELKQGDTVVDIGCGTGLNFEFLLPAIGETGRIIGVDLTEGMLAKAAERIAENGWKNIELVQSDAAEFVFPGRVDAILSTYALTFVPGFETVIAQGFNALTERRRFAVLDMKTSDKWPGWMVRLIARSIRGFGITHDLSARKPWEIMRKHGTEITMQEYFGGFAYLAVSEKRPGAGRA